MYRDLPGIPPGMALKSDAAPVHCPESCRSHPRAPPPLNVRHRTLHALAQMGLCHPAGRFGWSPTGGQWKRLRDRCRSYTFRHPQRRGGPGDGTGSTRRGDTWLHAAPLTALTAVPMPSGCPAPAELNARRTRPRARSWQMLARCRPPPQEVPGYSATPPRRSRRLDTGRHTCLAVPSPHRRTLCGAGMCATASACSAAFYHSPLPSRRARVSQAGPSAGNCRSSFSSYSTYKVTVHVVKHNR